MAKLPSISGNEDRSAHQAYDDSERNCLRKLILFGRRHLDHVVSGWVEYYNSRRSHMVRENLPPVCEKTEEVIQIDRNQVMVRSYVGGLVKSFERRVA